MALSTLFTAIKTGLFALRRIWATSISRSVVPVSTSTTKIIQSDSSTAILTCFLISASKISSDPVI